MFKSSVALGDGTVPVCGFVLCHTVIFSNFCLTILELLTVVIMKAVLETELVGFGTTN